MLMEIGERDGAARIGEVEQLVRASEPPSDAGVPLGAEDGEESHG
jgi:hypothetical protein